MEGNHLDSRCLDGITCRRIGKVVNFHGEVSSTNKVAREMAEGGCIDGMVIVAESQSSGRGRLDRSWVSPAGGLYLSVVLRPDVPVGKTLPLPLIFSLSVSKVISVSALVESSVKWPNDVLISGKKVCGILVESSVKGEELEYIIVGIGINVNNDLSDLDEETRTRSTTLKQEKGETIDTRELLRDLLYLLDLHYDRFLEGGTLSMLDEWSERSSTIGKKVRVVGVRGELEGKALGVDQNGSLMLNTGSRISAVSEGDCYHLD